MSCSTRLLAVVLLATPANGVWAGEPLVIAGDGTPTQPKQPQVFVDEQGTIHATFGATGAVYYTRLGNNGRAFGLPVKVGEVARLALGMRRGPRIAAAAGNLVIAAIGHEDGNVRAWRSLDGLKWEEPVTINDSPRDAREGMQALACGPKGELFCVWLDCRDQQRGSRIFGSGSTDGGRTWTKNREVYHSPSGSVCECCHPSATFDASGNLLVMWRNSLAGSRDMYWAKSTDSGKTFGPATKLGTGTWPLKACPMDGGNLAVTPGGKLFTAWRRDREVFLTSPGSAAEQRLGDGKQPWIAATDKGPHVVWLSPSGQLMHLAPGARQPEQLAERAGDPVIATGPAGKGPLVVAWEGARGQQKVLMCEVLSSGK